MSKPIQRSLAEVRQMPSGEISRALRAGELDELMAGRDPGGSATDEFAVFLAGHIGGPPATADQGARGDPPLGQITDPSVLRGMTPEERVAARKAGRLMSLGIAP
jgi:hypothetical protein